MTEPCAKISIQSIGNSKDVVDGFYTSFIFGTYKFASIDARGNNIHYANIGGYDYFICKDMNNIWLVRIARL